MIELIIDIGISREKHLIIGYLYRFKFFISCIPSKKCPLTIVNNVSMYELQLTQKYISNQADFCWSTWIYKFAPIWCATSSKSKRSIKFQRKQQTGLINSYNVL